MSEDGPGGGSGAPGGVGIPAPSAVPGCGAGAGPAVGRVGANGTTPGGPGPARALPGPVDTSAAVKGRGAAASTFSRAAPGAGGRW